MFFDRISGMKKTKNRSFNKKQPYGCFVFSDSGESGGARTLDTGLKRPVL